MADLQEGLLGQGHQLLELIPQRASLPLRQIGAGLETEAEGVDRLRYAIVYLPGDPVPLSPGRLLRLLCLSLELQVPLRLRPLCLHRLPSARYLRAGHQIGCDDHGEHRSHSDYQHLFLAQGVVYPGVRHYAEVRIHGRYYSQQAERQGPRQQDQGQPQ